MCRPLLLVGDEVEGDAEGESRILDYARHVYHHGAGGLHVATPPPREGVADELGVVGVVTPGVEASGGDHVEVAVEDEEPLRLRG